VRVVVPYAVDQPKTRLASVLSPAERVAFSAAMCRDVCAAIHRAGETPELLATAPVEFADALDSVPVTVDDRPLTDAVNAVLTETLASSETAYESATDRREGADDAE
jgi:2-phospho-L-lactate guanylyltransferase